MNTMNWKFAGKKKTKQTQSHKVSQSAIYV